MIRGSLCGSSLGLPIFFCFALYLILFCNVVTVYVLLTQYESRDDRKFNGSQSLPFLVLVAMKYMTATTELSEKIIRDDLVFFY
jgi:hypothetical protein